MTDEARYDDNPARPQRKLTELRHGGHAFSEADEDGFDGSPEEGPSAGAHPADDDPDTYDGGEGREW